MDQNNEYFDKVQTYTDEAQSSTVEKNSGKAVFFAGLISGLAISLLLVGIFYLGFGAQSLMNGQKNERTDEVQNEAAVIPQGEPQTVVLNENSAINAETVEKLKALEKEIKTYYYLDEVSNETLTDGMYKGMLDALGDPYSEYYTVKELEDILQQTEGVYYGIGAYVGLDDVTGYPKISSVIANSPAEDMKMRPDDLIYEVDGQSTAGLSLDQAVSLIRGPEGTDVTLTVIRDGKQLTVTLTRRRVESPTVKVEMKEDGIAYIQVTEFDDVTVEQFENALNEARNNNAKGIILDLRANPGGSLRAVVNMCELILPKGMIVYTENKEGKRSEYTSTGKHELELPLVVLVDHNSASASEIMAGAIKDYGIGTLVGTTTYGKGIVQQIRPLSDMSAVKLTISAYYTPSGKNIHGIGIEPDITCDFDGEAYYGSDDHPDNQLDKAIEVMKQKIGK